MKKTKRTKRVTHEEATNLLMAATIGMMAGSFAPFLRKPTQEDIEEDRKHSCLNHGWEAGQCSKGLPWLRGYLLYVCDDRDEDGEE